MAKTWGEMSPAEHAEAKKRALTQLQAELTQAAPQIAAILAEKEN